MDKSNIFKIGLDIGGTAVKAGAADGNGKILAKASIETGAQRPYMAIFRDVAAVARRVAADAGIPWDNVSGVGVGVPGTVNSAAGEVVYANNLPFRNAPIGSELFKILGKPIQIENDANAAGYGEYLFGAGRKYSSSLFVTLGTGVGGGIVVDGKIFSGFKSAGAEIGHMVIAHGGAPCTCGQRGCFEAYASVTGLARLTAETAAKYPDSLLAELVAERRKVGKDAGGKTAFDAAAGGDKAGAEVVGTYIEYLADGIVSVVNLIRPQAVIIGGGVSAQGETLLAPLRKSCYAKVYGGTDYAPFDILTAQLGNDAGLLGAAFL
ncbi:MAG: ROK family protein [Clostridiales bacterium]|jgi:glucokinase|nr:ROK family protein [Clostridiales bacterium]